MSGTAAFRARLAGLAAAGLLLLALPARSAFLDLGYGARAPGMGDAFTAVADDVYAIFYNPAGLADLRAPEFSASYSLLYLGLTDNSSLGQADLAFETPLKGGDWGHLGLGWHRFALDSLYSEQSFYVSYAGTPLRVPFGDSLQWGVNLKYLYEGFAQPPEASNSFFTVPGQLGVVQPGVPDPALQNTSQTAFDADAGLLYRLTDHYSAGLMVEHLLEPNVGFASNEPLGRAERLGLSYRTLWTNLAVDLHFDPAADGSTDETVIVAAERYFPTLSHGQFGVRGSFGIGTDDVRNLTVGLSYRINAIQADYAFLMPLGTIAGTYGTHRLALTYHFGAPPAEDEFAAQVMQALREAPPPAAVVGYAYEFEGLKQLALQKQALAAVIRADLEQGRYQQALGLIEQMAGARDPALEKLRTRLQIITTLVPTLENPKLKWELVMASGIVAWFDDQDATSVKRLAYAYSLHTDEPASGVLAAVEAASGLKGDRVSPQFSGKLSLVEEKLLDMQVHLRQGRAAEALKLGRQVLELEPSNPTALARVGTALYLLGQPEEAIARWSEALQIEKSPEERNTLVHAIKQVSAQLKKPALGTAAAAAAEPAPAAPAPAAAPVAAPTQPSSSADPREIERLYREGVELYAAGDTMQAAEAFRRILEIDPNNAQALKALQRLKLEQ
jgi:tetratricopeptide (TPR) repeat protein